MTGDVRLRYRPALDGVRALAVVAVLLFHAGLAWLPGGFLGVDVFFVLSGFLITSLLLAERSRTGQLALRSFWLRRARRLLPALLLLLGVVTVAAPLLVAPADRSRLHGDVLAALGYVANWRFAWSGQSYFDATAPPSPLLHTWSLAIEEQFYLVWPVVVLVALWLARGRQWLVGTVAVAGAVASAVACAVLYVPGADVRRIYYGTDTRAQALLVGAAAAVLLRSADAAGRLNARRRQALGALSALGLALLAAAAAGVGGGSPWLYRGGFAVVAVAAAAVVAGAALAPRGPVARVLAVPPLVWLGRISYGVYLWHWPVYRALSGTRTGLHGPALLAARLAATLAVAAASYAVVEQPLRRWRRPSWRTAAVWPAAAATAAACAAVVVGAVAAPVPSATAASGRSAGIGPAGGASSVGGAASVAGPHRAPRLVVVGDSVAHSLAEGLRPLAVRHGFEVADEAVVGCGITHGGYRYFGDNRDELPECAALPDAWRTRVAADEPAVVAVLLGRWDTMDRLHDGRWMRIGEPEYDAYLTDQLERTVADVRLPGVRVVLLTAAYYLRGERPDGGIWPEDETWRIDRWNAIVRSVGAREGMDVVELGEHVTPGGVYRNSVDGILLREDGVHFTPEGVRWLAPWLLPRIAPAVTSARMGT